MLPTPQGVELLDFDISAGSNLSMPSTISSTGQRRMIAFCLLRGPIMSLRQFSASHITAFAQSRLGYSTEQLKLAPAMMVSENCTRWCHPLLYEDCMPRVLQGRSFGIVSGSLLIHSRCACGLRSLHLKEQYRWDLRRATYQRSPPRAVRWAYSDRFDRDSCKSTCFDAASVGAVLTQPELYVYKLPSALD